ncbi:hypothetical protein ACJX0J_009062, partial [Zea mays]
SEDADPIYITGKTGFQRAITKNKTYRVQNAIVGVGRVRNAAATATVLYFPSTFWFMLLAVEPFKIDGYLV